MLGGKDQAQNFTHPCPGAKLRGENSSAERKSKPLRGLSPRQADYSQATLSPLQGYGDLAWICYDVFVLVRLGDAYDPGPSVHLSLHQHSQLLGTSVCLLPQLSPAVCN